MGWSDRPGAGLVGRRREREDLARLLDAVRAGEGRALVLRGEAGVGKTALLEDLVERARDGTVVRASGVEWEMELAFSGLHQLCAPMLGSVPRLPAAQRDVLQTAFGLASGPPPDRFRVALAVLMLLAEAAERQPLICVVDDAQWLDQASAATLVFVARRLVAERIALVFAARAASEDQGFGTLPVLDVGPLSADDAEALLDASTLGPLDPDVRARILAEARGNPLALLELPRGLTPRGGVPGVGVPPATTPAGQIEQGFTRRLEELPPDTRRLLLLAALEPVGETSLLWRAAERLGLTREAAAPAVAAGLVELDARVRFRHPLVRSAIHASMTSDDRRAAHAALAEATDAEADPDRRAWHRAQAAATPDETVAAELERSAGRAQARGGIAAAAAFLQRAAQLTPDRTRRGARSLDAARATFEAAAPDTALELLGVAETCPLDALQRARLARLRAQIEYALRRGRGAPPLLLAAARQLEPLDPAAARETYLEAFGASLYAGRLHAASGVRDAAMAARAAPAAQQPPRSIDLVLDGIAARFTDGPAAGAPPLRRAVEAFVHEELDGDDDVRRWLRLNPVVQSMAVYELWDDEAYTALATRAVRLARETGALSILPVALVYGSGVHLFAGDFAAAHAMIREADAITAATGNAPILYAPILLCAWRGREAEATEEIAAAYESATARGEGRVLALVGYAKSLLCNGLGRYDAAIEGALAGVEDDDQGYAGQALGELVEAATRADRPELAAGALPRLEERARAAGTDWALGVLARSRALMSDGEEADALYREAIERLDRTRMRVEHARARLVYGEWLRRAHHPASAREHLRGAFGAFSRCGLEAFADRAAGELAAAGETVRPRGAAAGETLTLTPREAQIARRAAGGQSNADIAAQLFVSPRTVEHQLDAIYEKLGITARHQLREAVGDPADTPSF